MPTVTYSKTAKQLGDFLSRLRTDSAISGWYNNTTGVGATDKASDMAFLRVEDWSVDQLSDLYESDSLARRAVSAVVEDALREGFKIVDPKVQDQQATDKAGREWLKKAEERFAFSEVLSELLSESRLYGGVAFTPMYKDSGVLTSPLGKISGVASLQWAEPDVALPTAWDHNDLSPTLFEPSMWSIQLQGPGGGFKHQTMHGSRVHKVLGGYSTKRGRSGRRGKYPHWPSSVLKPVMASLAIYRSSMASIAALIQDASQAVFKLHHLNQIMAGPDTGAEKLMDWLTIRNMLRSVANAVVLDAGNKDAPAESFERVVTPLQEMADLIDREHAAVSESTGIPITRLFGQAPSGLSTDDLSGTRVWFDQVHQYRTKKAEPLIRLLVSIMSHEIGEPPADYEIEWPSLWQYSPQEQAQARLTSAQSDAIYLANKVVKPREVAVTRAQPDGWRLDLSIDTAESKEAEKKGANIVLTPSDTARVIKVFEARASQGLEPFGDERDELTVEEYAQSLAEEREGRRIEAQKQAAIEEQAAVDGSEGEAQKLPEDPPSGFEGTE